MTATDRDVRVWAVPTMEPVIPPIIPASGVVAADLNPDGTTVLVADGDGWLEVHPVTPGAKAWRRRDEGIRAAQFTADGRSVLVVDLNTPTARLLDAATGRRTLTVRDDESRRGLVSATVTADGARLVTDGLLGPTRVWSTRTGEALATLSGGNALVAISPAGDLVAQALAGTVIVSDANTGRKVAETERSLRRDTQAAHIFAVAFSPDGRGVAVSAEDVGVRIHDPRTGLPTSPRFDDPDAEGVVFSPDGRDLVTAGRWGAAVFDVGTGRRLAVMGDAVPGQPAPVGVAFSRDGRYLAVHFGGPVELWERRR